MSRIAPDTRAQAQALRRDQTPAERRLWLHLREANRMLGCHFRRQAPIGPYIADFAEFRLRLIIEADGGGHGDARDARRDHWLAAQGFAVLRFWNAEVLQETDSVMQRILDFVEAAPPPHPSPTGGEGGAGHLGGKDRP